MNKEKQIEEMAKVIRGYARDYDDDIYGCEDHLSHYLTEAGYLKASEVAEEIKKYILEGAATIQSDNPDSLYGAKFAIEKVVLPILEAYEKKYTESEKEND